MERPLASDAKFQTDKPHWAPATACIHTSSVRACNVLGATPSHIGRVLSKICTPEPQEALVPSLDLLLLHAM